MTLTKDELVRLRMDYATAKRVIELQQAYRSRQSTKKRRTLSFRLSFSNSPSTAGLTVGDRVLIVPQEDVESCALWTIKGMLLGTFKLAHHPIPEWWRTPHLVASAINDVETAQDGGVVLTLETVEI
jgi:hypothetical protein